MMKGFIVIVSEFMEKFNIYMVIIFHRLSHRKCADLTIEGDIIMTMRRVKSVHEFIGPNTSVYIFVKKDIVTWLKIPGNYRLCLDPKLNSIHVYICIIGV